MILPRAPSAYSQSNEQQTRDAIQQSDARVVRTDRDAVFDTGVRLVLRDTVTGDPYSITIASGVITATAL